MATDLVSPSQAAILARTIVPGTGMSLAMARFLTDLKLTSADLDRMNELAAKARLGTLSLAEEQEIDDYRHVGHLLERIKSEARLLVQRAATG